MIDNEAIIKRLLSIIDNVATYKQGNTVYLSDGTSFELPAQTTIQLTNSKKSYR